MFAGATGAWRTRCSFARQRIGFFVITLAITRCILGLNPESWLLKHCARSHRFWGISKRYVLTMDGGLPTFQPFFMPTIDSLRKPLPAVPAMLMLCCLAHAAVLPEAGVVRLPVIDRQDIRFLPVSVNGESLQARVMAQDNYGVIWLMLDGLYRYDGYSFSRYRNTRGQATDLSYAAIKFVYKDRTGILWIGTSYTGLYRLDPSHDTVTNYRHSHGDSRSLNSDSVTCGYQDRDGVLWFGTHGGVDRLDPATGTFVHYTHDPRDASSLSHPSVEAILEDRQGNLWVGTQGGLNKLDRATGRFSRYLHDSTNPHSIGHDYASFILEDQSGVLWLGSSFGNGLSALDVKTGRFTRYSFHVDDPGSQSVTGVTSMFLDADGAIWLCTVDRGLLNLDRDRTKFFRYARDPDNPNSLPFDTVESMFKDAEGVWWVSTQNGLSRFPDKPSPFVTYSHQVGNPNSLRGTMIWSVYEDSKGFLWIGTDDGLNRLDRKTGQFTFYQHDPKDPHSLSYDKVSAIREDRSGTLWLGTYGGGLDRFDRTTGRFFAYRHDGKNPDSLSSDAVLSFLMDRRGVMWVCTQGGGLNRFDPGTGGFKAYPTVPYAITSKFEDRAGILWFGTGNGLIRFDPRTEEVTVYRHDSKDPRTLSNDRVTGIVEDRQGMFWIGTESGLDQMDRSRGTFTAVTTKDSFPDSAVRPILEDPQGYLWLATQEGLSRFDPRTRIFHNYSESDGLLDNFINPHGAEGSFQTQAGEIILGSRTGVTAFFPDRLADSPYIPHVVLTNFLLFNKSVYPAADSPLHQPIWATDALTLTHKQNIFTLEFAALSYAAPEKNRYRYRLLGLENDWNEVDSRQRLATYTNLSPSKYVFQVQGSNNDGVWNPKITALAITVLPPLWATWWFTSLATLAIAAAIFAAYRARVRGLELAGIRLETQVAERTRELEIAKVAAERASRAKSSFLAHMSHELRTPLNSILGFSAMVREAPELSEKHREDLATVSRSGEHLLGLIDDVLDTAKIEAGRITLNQVSFDLGDLVSNCIVMMRVRASEKGLQLFLQTNPDVPRFVRCDAGRLRQVLINLIGNAVKFTERGSVTVRVNAGPVDSSGNILLILEVEDTGIGIAPEDQARIFDVFVQAGQLSAQKGTGLGLSITQQFVQMMGGAIRVESSIGKGSLFTVELPVQKAEEATAVAASVVRGQVACLAPGQRGYRILIVEDKKENWLLLRRLLEDAGFQVQIAENGAEGIEQFLAFQPDLIWMDVRLPVMGGLEAAGRIRALEGGRLVKIVALTASAFAQQREEVLAAGLDDFLRKPYRRDEIFDCMSRHLGLQYVYRESPRARPAEPTATLRPETISRLPESLRKELADALVRLDAGPIREVIGRVSQQDTELGEVLSRLARRFAYTEILNALMESTVRVRKEGA